MRISYIFYLAYKNLLCHKMRTILTASGVAISVAFVVFLMSFGLGLQRVSVNQVTNLEALQVLDVTPGKSKTLLIDNDMINKFLTLSNVIEAYPQVSSASKISYNKSNIDGVVYGKDAKYLELEGVKLLNGRQYSSDSADEAIINVAARDQLAVADILDKEITINVVIRSELLVKGQESTQFTKTLKVVGVINDKSAPFIYTPSHIFTDNGVVNYSSAKVKVKSKDDVTQTKLEVENMGFKASSIKETIDQINQFFSIFQVILVAFGSIAILVACLGVFNTLTISLIEKTREVGFMKALGTQRHDIYWLFTMETMIIGIAGSVLGLVIGLSAGGALNGLITNLARSSGNQAVELFYIPIYMIAMILAISFFVSLLTGLYPARRAAKISPLDALRYE